MTMFPFNTDKEGPDASSMWSSSAMGQPTPSNPMLSRAELISIIDEVLDILREDDNDFPPHLPSNISPYVAEEEALLMSPTVVRGREAPHHREHVTETPPSSSDSSLLSQTPKAKKPRRQ